jgi:hypothetical protein
MKRLQRIAAGRVQVHPLHADDLRTKMFRAMARCPWLPADLRMDLRIARHKVKFALREFKKRARAADSKNDLEEAGAWYRMYTRLFEAYNKTMNRVIQPTLASFGCDPFKANWLRFAIVHHEINEKRRKFIEADRQRRLGSVRVELDFSRC